MSNTYGWDEGGPPTVADALATVESAVAELVGRADRSDADLAELRARLDRLDKVDDAHAQPRQDSALVSTRGATLCGQPDLKGFTP